MAPLSLKQENQSAFKVCESVRVHLIKHVSSWWIFHHSWHLLLFASRKSHGIQRRADIKGKSPGVEGGRDMQHVSDPNCWKIRQQTSICQQSENEMENDSKRQQKEEHTEGGLSDKARNGMRQCNNSIKTRNSLSDKHLEWAFIWVCRFVMFTQTVSVYSLLFGARCAAFTSWSSCNPGMIGITSHPNKLPNEPESSPGAHSVWRHLK